VEAAVEAAVLAFNNSARGAPSMSLAQVAVVVKVVARHRADQPGTTLPAVSPQQPTPATPVVPDTPAQVVVSLELPIRSRVVSVDREAMPVQPGL
jgi:hypothetical protein